MWSCIPFVFSNTIFEIAIIWFTLTTKIVYLAKVRFWIIYVYFDVKLFENFSNCFLFFTSSLKQLLLQYNYALNNTLTIFIYYGVRKSNLVEFEILLVENPFGVSTNLNLVESPIGLSTSRKCNWSFYW